MFDLLSSKKNVQTDKTSFAMQLCFRHRIKHIKR